MQSVSQMAGLLLAAALMAVFLASAFAKAAYWEDTRSWFRQLFPALPERLAPLAVGTVIGAEVLVAAAVAVLPMVGGVAAGGWMVIASAVLIQARHRASGCGCFGLRQRLGAGVVIRNLLVPPRELSSALPRHR
jgi:hypothetical protein